VVDAMDVKPKLVFVESKSETQKKEPEPATKTEYASITFLD